MAIRRPVVEHTLGQESMTNKIQRTLDGLHSDMSGSIANLTASQIAFTATAADWVAPLPTNLQDAINRLAASAGVHPVP